MRLIHHSAQSGNGRRHPRRNGALAVEAYRDMGYLPETMRNYLLRLGWSHGDDEFITTERAIEWFDLSNIGRSPSRIDFKKLDNLNAHYLRALDDAALTAEVEMFLARTEPPYLLSDTAKERLFAAMPGLKERAKTLVELSQAAGFLFTDGARSLDAAAEKLLTIDARRWLAELVALFQHSEWTAPALEAQVRNLAEAKGLKLGQLAQPLRAALTGKAASPPIFDMLVVLGKKESLLRLGAFAA